MRYLLLLCTNSEIFTFTLYRQGIFVAVAHSLVEGVVEFVDADAHIHIDGVVTVVQHHVPTELETTHLEQAKCCNYRRPTRGPWATSLI